MALPREKAPASSRQGAATRNTLPAQHKPISLSMLNRDTFDVIADVASTGQPTLVTSYGRFVGQIVPYSDQVYLHAGNLVVITVQQLQVGLLSLFAHLEYGLIIVVTKADYPDDERLVVITHYSEREMIEKAVSRGCGTNSSGPR